MPFSHPKSEPYDAALHLARKGLRVFPVDGKIPRVRVFKTVATTNENQLAKWWQKWPDANIGINLDGLMVIGVDGEVGNANLHRLAHLPRISDSIFATGQSEVSFIFQNTELTSRRNYVGPITIVLASSVMGRLGLTSEI